MLRWTAMHQEGGSSVHYVSTRLKTGGAEVQQGRSQVFSSLGFLPSFWLRYKGFLQKSAQAKIVNPSPPCDHLNLKLHKKYCREHLRQVRNSPCLGHLAKYIEILALSSMTKLWQHRIQAGRRLGVTAELEGERLLLLENWEGDWRVSSRSTLWKQIY